MPSIHSEIASGPLLVRKEFLYNMESGYDEFLPAKIFAVSSYPGHAPTFKALIQEKYIFSYLPINAFASKEVEPLSLDDSNYFNCPSEVFSINTFSQLRHCQVFNKDASWLGCGIIIMTIDWYMNNELCHVVELDTGNFVLRPSHKVVMSDYNSPTREVLPKFKKLKYEWII